MQPSVEATFGDRLWYVSVLVQKRAARLEVAGEEGAGHKRYGHHLGGALARPPADLSPIGRRDSKFVMMGVGATPTPEVAQLVQANLARLAEEMRPYETGATYLNFLELDGASPERVRAAYSPEDWQRLVGLKDRYDPGNLFRFNRNIPPSSVRE
jgi:hypothetical protein